DLGQQLARQLGRLAHRGIARLRRQRPLEEAPGARLVAAQGIALGDAELGARDLLLAEELVARGKRGIARLQRARLAQRGAEMALAEQVLDPGKAELGLRLLRHRPERRRIGIDSPSRAEEGTRVAPSTAASTGFARTSLFRDLVVVPMAPSLAFGAVSPAHR